MLPILSVRNLAGHSRTGLSWCHEAEASSGWIICLGPLAGAIFFFLTTDLWIMLFHSKCFCYNDNEGKKVTNSLLGSPSPGSLHILSMLSPGTPASNYIPKMCTLGELVCLNDFRLSESVGMTVPLDGMTTCPGEFLPCARAARTDSSHPWPGTGILNVYIAHIYFNV